MADKKVVIEDALLISMAQNTAYLKEFPFLAALRTQQPGVARCGRCSAKSKAGQTLGAIRTVLGDLSEDKAAKLKQMLGAASVQLRYKDRRGQSAQRTF